MDGHDPYAYLKHLLTRLPTQRESEIEQLLPHQWKPDLCKVYSPFAYKALENHE